MTYKRLLLLSLPVFFVIACGRDDAPADADNADTAQSETGAAAADDDAATAGDSSRTAVEWAGTYSGVLPCGSCPGIETRITLDEDGSFERSTLRIDESSAAETDTGRFSWNTAGSRITLESADGELQQYLVGNNSLIQLDSNGERMTGESAGQYMLQKQSSDPAD